MPLRKLVTNLFKERPRDGLGKPPEGSTGAASFTVADSGMWEFFDDEGVQGLKLWSTI